MLFNSYKITRILPCLAAPEKIRVTAEVPGGIHEALKEKLALYKKGSHFSSRRSKRKE
jgi:ArsR family metal-binding transcriptional regulator